MNTHTLLRAPYQVARLPLTLVQSQVMPRMSNDSPPRLAFERALGSVDLAAGRLLHDDQLKTNGARLRTRAEDLSEAARLEADAAERKRAAAHTRQHGAQHADQLREQAEQHQVDGVRQTAARIREAKRDASIQVQTQAEKAKQRSQSRAERKLAAARNDRQTAERQAAAREQRAARRAQAGIADAAQQKAHARTRRADAGKLAELASAKNSARKQS
jgi:hypothetical protein